MNSDKALKLLRAGPQGVKEWNRQRESGEQLPSLRGVNLCKADLCNADLRGIDLSNANLAFANFCSDISIDGQFIAADLSQANLSGADLREACLRKAMLRRSNLSGSRLSFANLVSANLTESNLNNASLIVTNLSAADMRGANLEGAILQGAVLAEANLAGANLNNCSIYGVSVWDTNLSGAKQSNLVIAIGAEKPTITVDNLEVAQFIYLLLKNDRIRNVIDSITAKVVLILGRFTPERKAVLDAIRLELRKRDYCPVLFDFDSPESRDTHEMVTTLARLARFVIADITEPRSIPQELVSIVQTLPSVPVVPLLESGKRPWGMFDHIKRYPWVLEVQKYSDKSDLLEIIGDSIIGPAESRVNELRHT